MDERLHNLITAIDEYVAAQAALAASLAGTPQSAERSIQVCQRFDELIAARNEMGIPVRDHAALLAHEVNARGPIHG